ncbi:MAG: hypothetical protein PHY47_19165 [Lachnospiraceae bacterium]|nr:hypothetical protein [Lachnospiraceae bacterium]
MEKDIIRLLRANEIECRVATINEKGLSLLLYKDARVDQKILDETFGAFGWKRSHQCIDGNLYCTVEIYDKEVGAWVSKQDVGAVGFTEKEKSQASDSFKRACFNWGIGRELYTAPFIWISASKTDIQKRGDRFYCNDHFSVNEIEYNEDREIVGLIITNEKGLNVYEMKVKSEAKKTTQKSAILKSQMKSLKEELERTGIAMETVQDRYQFQKPETMSEEVYNKVMAALAKTKSVAAA